VSFTRAKLLAGAVVPLVLLAGCSGNTTPPQSVTQTSAELHATVSCNSGEHCSMYFKYGLADGSMNLQSPTYGPFAGPITNADAHWPTPSNLQPGTTYAYQVCGNNQSGGQFACIGPATDIYARQEFTTLPACTQTLSPGADVATAVQNAAAGAVVCLSPGTYAVSGSPAIVSANGTSSAPVTLTSANPASPATIDGRFVTHTPTQYLTISHLRFTWNSASESTMVLGGSHVTLSHNDVSGGGETICINASDDQGNYPLTLSTIDHNRIHDCGNPNDPNPVIGDGDKGHAQGVYTNPNASDLDISNNYCYRVAARCYQERFGHNDDWTHNTADFENWAYHFGDGNPHDNTMTGNISGPDHYRYTSSGFYHGGDLSVFGGGTNETFSSNCWQGETNGPLGNVTMTNNTVATVQFMDAANGNFHLKPNTPCQGFGPTGSTPGP
jgi:hypothetical protein